MPAVTQRVMIDVGDKLGAPAGEEPAPATVPAAGAKQPNPDVVGVELALQERDALRHAAPNAH